MVKIVMTDTAFGATSNFEPKAYIKGRIYDIDADLALSFTRQGVAKLLRDDSEKDYTPQSLPTEYETKVLKPSAKRGRPPKKKNEI